MARTASHKSPRAISRGGKAGPANQTKSRLRHDRHSGYKQSRQIAIGMETFLVTRRHGESHHGRFAWGATACDGGPIPTPMAPGRRTKPIIFGGQHDTRRHGRVTIGILGPRRHVRSRLELVKTRKHEARADWPVGKS